MKVRKEDNMQKYNLIIVYDKEYKHVLMCLREKEPFLGLYNFVGGKIESNETDQEQHIESCLRNTYL